MFKIIVNGMRFHAYHGVYEIEKNDGGFFEVDIELDIQKDLRKIDDKIDRTYDYSRLYEIVAKVMAKRVHLLEKIAWQLSEALKSDESISDYVIRVRKLSPPLPGPVKSIAVELDSRNLPST